MRHGRIEMRTRGAFRISSPRHERVEMLGIGVDIGSTATKVAVLDGAGEIVETWMRPTGFSSVDAANGVAEHLEEQGFFEVPHAVVATGYGRRGGAVRR